MRRLRHPEIIPPTLAKGGKGHRVAKRHLDEMQKGSREPRSFPDYWNEGDVRGALYAMHGWVCAYCQCFTADDVDHFRPKSLYWWLAYSFINYFLSCETCNRRYKRNMFPLEGGARRMTFSRSVDIEREARLLLDPTRDSVEDWMRTEFKEARWQVKNLMHRERESTAWARVEETIRLFGLNKRVELRKQRQKVIEEAVTSLESSDPARIEDLRRKASRFEPHGMTVRTVLEQLSNVLPPSPEEELRWLVGDFVELLQIDDHELEREEIRWALAVLWKDLLVGDPAEVESCLRSAGVVDEIQPYYDQL